MGRSVGFKIVIAMMAFAANSVLCRIALKGEHIDPVTFSDLRLMSGAVVLLPLLLRREGKKQGVWSLKSGFFLMTYALCFSLAYIHLDTGTGALLLFGVVQLAMVAHGLFHGERLSFQSNGAWAGCSRHGCSSLTWCQSAPLGQRCSDGAFRPCLGGLYPLRKALSQRSAGHCGKFHPCCTFCPGVVAVH